jgi:hypothetical protein
VIYFSENPLGEGSVLSNPILRIAPGESADLHIYVIPDLADQFYRSISLDVESSNAAVATLAEGETLNFDIVLPSAGDLDLGNRWDQVENGSLVGEPLNPDIIRLEGLTGVAIFELGLDPLNRGSDAPLDRGYDQVAEAFYVGWVRIQAVAEGAADLRFRVGGAGIVRAGDSIGNAAPILFGSDEPTTVFGDQFGATGDTPDAQIIVVPEPSVGSLSMVATILLLGRCRHRRRRGP